jgi:hypothetical protein
MPKSTEKEQERLAAAAAARQNGDQRPNGKTAAMLCGKADALYRAAVECCRQHERVARLVAREAPPEELRAATAQVKHCDGALGEMAAAYEKCGARLHPDGDDAGWWHRANSLWHASREYARRHDESMRARRSAAEEREPEALGQLNIEYELEASALLALRQATEAYEKVRPHAHC